MLEIEDTDQKWAAGHRHTAALCKPVMAATICEVCSVSDILMLSQSWVFLSPFYA